MNDVRKNVELYENKNQLLNALIDKITVEIINKHNNSSEAQAIVLTGCSPVAGVTSVSISLAIAMAATGRKTLLIDCDVRKADLYKKLNDYAKIGLSNYISTVDESAKRVDEIIYETNIDNLSYIPCGDSGENPTRVLCSEKMGDMLDNLKKEYDSIILDCPSVNVVPDASIFFSRCDGIILVAALGETKKSQIKDAKMIIRPYASKYYGMIINKCKKDILRANLKNYDYYLLDKNGKQHFEKTKTDILKKINRRK